MEQFIGAFVAFGLAMLGMSIGALLVGKQLKGTCGSAARDCGVDDGKIPSCDACENPEEEKARCARRKRREQRLNLC